MIKTVSIRGLKTVIIRPANIARELRATARLLEREGWIKGVTYRQGCGYCIIGAMQELDCVTETMQVLDDHLNLLYACHTDLVEWNDNPQQTKENVINELLACAVSQDVKELALVAKERAILSTSSRSNDEAIVR